jgi:hypothetical protein
MVINFIYQVAVVRYKEPQLPNRMLLGNVSFISTKFNSLCAAVDKILVPPFRIIGGIIVILMLNAMYEILKNTRIW